MCTQHRYEDLVEGAISLYSIETTEYHTIETITKEEFPEVLIGKDMRGKSADIFPTYGFSILSQSFMWILYFWNLFLVHYQHN